MGYNNTQPKNCLLDNPCTDMHQPAPTAMFSLAFLIKSTHAIRNGVKPGRLFCCIYEKINFFATNGAFCSLGGENSLINYLSINLVINKLGNSSVKVCDLGLLFRPPSPGQAEWKMKSTQFSLQPSHLKSQVCK